MQRFINLNLEEQIFKEKMEKHLRTKRKYEKKNYKERQFGNKNSVKGKSKHR